MKDKISIFVPVWLGGMATFSTIGHLCGLSAGTSTDLYISMLVGALCAIWVTKNIYKNKELKTL